MKKWKLFLKTVIISICCCGIFVAVGYFYLQKELEPAENGGIESVPYYSAAPENTGILLEICEEKTFFFLDFERESLSVIYADDVIYEENEIYGYSIDYTVSGDYNLLGAIVDLTGGVEMEYQGEQLTLTGVQIAEIFSTTADTKALRRELTEKIISKIGKNGFKKEDFLYIIKNSKTDLTVPVCYYWSEYIKELCRSARMVN